MKTKEIFIVPHFHYDVAYCDTFKGYLPRSLENLKEMLRLMKKYPEFTFLVEQTILLEVFWQKYPESRPLLKQYAQEGRLEVACGMFVMPDMNLISGESLIRQAVLGKKWLREKLGIEAETCWIADCWGHHAQIPQILKKCGYSYYAFSRAMPEEIATRSEFYWQGLDGTKILTHWMPIGYDGFCFLTGEETNEWIFLQGPSEEVNQARLQSAIKKLQGFQGTPYLLLPCGADFRRPEKSIIEGVRRWNRKHPGTKIAFSRSTDFFRRLEGEKARIPVHRADLNPAWQGTYSSRIEIKQRNRQMEEMVLSAEKLNALCCLLGGNDKSRLLERIWKDILFNQFHDIMAGSIIDDAYREAMEKYQGLEKRLPKVISETMEDLAGKINISNDGLSLLVFNPSGFERQDVIETEVILPKERIEGFKVIDGNNKEMPSQIIAKDNTRFTLLFVDTLPALGYKIYHLRPRKKTPSYSTGPRVHSDSIENRFFKIKFHPQTGALTSLFLKKTKQEIVDPQRPFYNDLVYQLDGGDFWVCYEGPVDGVRRTTTVYPDPMPEGGNVPLSRQGIHSKDSLLNQVSVIENGPVRVTLQVKGKLVYGHYSCPFLQKVHIYSNLARIDFMTEFLPSGRNYRLRACFPTNIKKGNIRYEIPYGVVKRPEGEYPAWRWVEYADKEKGVCLINQGLPGNNITDGIMMLSLFRAVNIKGRNDTETGFGEGNPQEFRYTLRPFSRADKTYLPHREAEKINSPFLSKIVSPGQGNSPDAMSFLAVSPDNVALSCFRKEGDNLILRLYETTGRRVKATVTWKGPLHLSEARETNCLQKELKKRSFKGNKLSFSLAPFEIKNFVLTLTPLDIVDF